MSSRVCSHCGCSDIDVDAARGDAVCTNCGSVLEEQIIVSEVQFEDTGKGGSSVIGQFVSSEGNKTPNLGTSFHHGMGKESRAITLQNGKKKIQHVGNQLRLNQHCIDTAFNFFKMAVTARLTRGRKTTHVVAACLYLVCRTEGTPHMLLDFSDVLQVNVYSLGRTYLQLSKELCINIPVLDPCLYIQRFAHHLEFEDKTHEVSMTALRLVSRMKRDWIAQGRRPSGLCGAALLVAARIHNFNRTLKQVLKVVRVSETTIRKRLKEFGETPSGQLTVEEFHNIDLEEESDPPSFTEGKRRAKLQLFEDDGKLPELTSEISNVQAEIEKALEDSRPKKRGPYANIDKPPPAPSINSEDTASACEQFIESEILTDALDFASQNDDETQKEQVKAKLEKLDSNSDNIPSKCVSDSDKSYTGFVKSDSQTETDLDNDRLQQQEFDSVLMPPPWSSKEEGGASNAGLRPTAASLGLKESIEECLRVDEKTDHELEDGELDLTGIDDAELDVFILTPEEAARKTEVWMKFNAAYLQEQKEKEEREAKEREAGGKQEKKKRKYKKKTPIQASTAGEAIEKIIQERRISNKINYDVLKDLREQEQVPVKKKDPDPILSKIQVVGAVTLKSTTEKRFRKSSISLETKSEPEEPPAKKMALEQAPSGGMQEVIVETGPVEYIKEDPGYDEEDDAADYYEEDEEHVSAAQLLGHHVEEDEGDMYDDYMD